MTTASRYRGRFAPSPTGPLHQGSLLSALASYLDARANKGQWLVRIEDIDPPREVDGAADLILRSLEAHALHWDDSVLYQSTRRAAYEGALDELRAQGQLFSCCCTRAILGPSGSCGRRCEPQAADAVSLRFGLTGRSGFDDIFLGAQPGTSISRDIVLRRKDGLFAYALAVVVDDAWQNITHVIRGRDLLHQTQAQRALFDQLNLTVPRYGHHPVICDAMGNKLSKQSGAPAIDDQRALSNLRQALRALGQMSATAEAGSAQELVSIATKSWIRKPLLA